MPLIPLSEVVARVGTVPPAQIVSAVPKLKLGITVGFTVTVKVNAFAHCPAVGVNTYVPECWLSIVAGLQVPLIPLVDVAGKATGVVPAQILRAEPKLKPGFTMVLTVTVNVVVVAHNPDVGVNVYTAEAWLSTDAVFHVPVIPFAEVVGKTGTLPPLQILKVVPKLNVGVMVGFTVTVKLVVVAHWPAEGVKI